MRKYGVFVFIIIFILLLQYTMQVQNYTKIGSGNLIDLYSSSHIFDCRENKTSYDQGHFQGAIYFDPKEFTKDKSEYTEKSLSGIFKTNIVFYSGNDRIEKKDTGQIIEWPGYYAQNIIQYIEVLPLYEKFTFYAVSEDINIWLTQHPEWTEQEINTLPHGALTTPTNQTYSENIFVLFFMIISIIISVSFVTFLIKTKINQKQSYETDEETIIKKRKILIKELSDSLSQNQRKKPEFKLRRRR